MNEVCLCIYDEKMTDREETDFTFEEFPVFD